MSKGQTRSVDERLKDAEKKRIAADKKVKALLQEKANEKKERAYRFAQEIWALCLDGEAQKKLSPEVTAAIKTHLLGYGEWVMPEALKPTTAPTGA